MDKEKTAIFICQWCPGTFASRRNLQRHEARHRRRWEEQRRASHRGVRVPALMDRPQPQPAQEEEVPGMELGGSSATTFVEGTPGDLIRYSEQQNLLLVAPTLLLGYEVPVEWSPAVARARYHRILEEVGRPRWVEPQLRATWENHLWMLAQLHPGQK